MPTHSSQLTNHVSYASPTYATAATRLADTTHTAADVGKTYLQTDDNSRWGLLTVTPTYEWLGGGTGHDQNFVLQSQVFS